MATKPTYYEILGVEKDANLREIKIAYRRLSLIWHPDRPTPQGYTKEQQEEKFKEIVCAYEILSDSTKRKAYDVNPSSFESGESNYPEHDEEYWKEYWEAQRELFREETIKNTTAYFVYHYIHPSTGYQIENPPLDSALWAPYSSWMEKIRKCSDEEANDFVDKLWKAAEEFKIKYEKDQQREIDENKRRANEKNKIRSNFASKIIEELSSNKIIAELELDNSLWQSYYDWNEKMSKIEISQVESFVNQMLSAIEKVKQSREEDRRKFSPTSNPPSHLPRNSQNGSFLPNLLKKEFVIPLSLFSIVLLFWLVARWQVKRKQRTLELIKFRLACAISANNLEINILNERNKFSKKYLSTGELLTPIIFESFLKLQTLLESVNRELIKSIEEKRIKFKLEETQINREILGEK